MSSLLGVTEPYSVWYFPFVQSDDLKNSLICRNNLLSESNFISVMSVLMMKVFHAYPDDR